MLPALLKFELLQSSVVFQVFGEHFQLLIVNDAEMSLDDVGIGIHGFNDAQQAILTETDQFEADFLDRVRRIHPQSIANEHSGLIADIQVLRQAELAYVAVTLFRERIFQVQARL